MDDKGADDWRTEGGLWKRLKAEAREMRRQPTEAEKILWEQLRRRSLGHHFRRQHPLGRYIVDFCCWKERLVVEVDGGVHLGRIAGDASRDEFIRSQGFRVLRFSNEQIFDSLLAVLASIQSALDANPILPG